MASSTPNINGVGQIAVSVRDLNRTVAFYRDVVGLPFLFEVTGMAFFDGGGVRLLFGEQREGTFEASIIYYRVDGIHDAYSRLIERGVETVAKPHFVAKMKEHELWLAFLKDPDGHTFALMAEIR